MKWMLNREHYHKWFKQVVDSYVPHNSVIVLDRASYHVGWDPNWGTPSCNLNRSELIKYILERGYKIEVGDNMNVVMHGPQEAVAVLVPVNEDELSRVSKLLQDAHVKVHDLRKMAIGMKKKLKYEVQTICEPKGIQVLFLPVHHPRLNVIEKVLAIMKTKLQSVHAGGNFTRAIEIGTGALKGITALQIEGMERKVICAEDKYIRDDEYFSSA
jgi:transposase